MNFPIGGFGQDNPFFIAPEIMVGKIVPNYKKFPGAQTRKSLVLNMGSYLNDQDNHAHQYYHFPHVGVAAGFSDLGNQENLGEEISLVPFISLNASRGSHHALNFKFGLGASYFTKFYNEETNRLNEAIGSSFNWTFNAFIYYNMIVGPHFTMQVGGGYWHSSNSHIQLPNYGLNSAMLSLAFIYYPTEIDMDLAVNKDDEKLSRQKFIQLRAGFGLQEFGGTIGPVGGPEYPVYTTAFNYGFLFNRQLKVYGGLFYRYYTSFYDYLDDNGERSVWQSSNVNFHLGVEYLLGHVGMNIEGGINLFKPFYDDYYDLFENGDAFNEFRMSTFNTRMGMNVYLKNTSKNPKGNVALGAHINANFGKADFGELSLTYVRRLR